MINGLASGAATAYTSAGNSSTGYAPIAAPGGLRTMDECDIHRLSIANEQCGRGRAGNADFGNQTAVKEEIIRRFIEPTKQKTAFTDTTVTLSSKHLDEGQTFYTHLSSENVELTATSLEYGTTHIVAAEGNITITGNITLPDVFASPSQVPQYIIYAEKDINIIGDVTEINAILIANGNINTCSRGACTKQLRINGSISANKIFLNRTYGAGIGANSLVPAEIINYDPSLFMWSGMMGSREINQSITETYIRELAPRQ